MNRQFRQHEDAQAERGVHEHVCDLRGVEFEAEQEDDQ